MRLIDADALINRIVFHSDLSGDQKEVFEDEINAELTIEPEREKGKWIDAVIPNDNDGLPVIVCNQCNTFFPLQFGASHNFCPNCGADMRGERDG